jgi:hypothetical protein
MMSEAFVSSAAVLLSVSLAAAETTPADQIVKLATGAYPDASITTPGGMKTHTVYRPTAETDKFSHNARIMPFKGKLYATWQATPRNENSTDSKGVLSVSGDGGSTWSAPTVLHEPIDEPDHLWRSPESLWTDGKTLSSLTSKRQHGYPAKTQTTEVRTTVDGVNWSEPEKLMGDVRVQDFHVLPGGRQLLVGEGRVRIGGRDWFGSRIFYNDKEKDGLSNWTEAELPNLLPKGGSIARDIEPAVFTRRDGNLVMLARDYGRSGHVLVSLSTDRGQTWSTPVESNIPENAYGNKQCAGNLPDGTPYFLFTPPGSGRGPLMLAVGGDGQTFDRIFEIRSDPPPVEFDGRSKYPGFSYPDAVAHDGKLYVIYATGKEHVDLSVIPTKSIVPEPAPSSVIKLGAGGAVASGERSRR